MFNTQNFDMWKMPENIRIERGIGPTTNDQFVGLQHFMVVLRKILQIVQPTETLQRLAVGP